MQFQNDACGLRRLADDHDDMPCRGTGLQHLGKAGDIWSTLHFILSFQLRKKARSAHGLADFSGEALVITPHKTEEWRENYQLVSAHN